MRNKKFKILIFLFMLLSVECVFAQDNNYYENANGVVVTEKEYRFISGFYDNQYFDKMSIEDYEWLNDLKINENDVDLITYYDYMLSSRGTSYGTASKKITIAKSCSTDCIIIVNCKWLINPVIRSYDVIGARFSGTNLVSNNITTKVTSSNGTEYFSNLKTLSDGFGVSVKLPNGTNISVEQKYSVSKSGTLYASYQHATSNISLTTSKLYTISSSGYGGVFDFYGAALNVFDAMNGVNISLS